MKLNPFSPPGKAELRKDIPEARNHDWGTRTKVLREDHPRSTPRKVKQTRKAGVDALPAFEISSGERRTGNWSTAPKILIELASFLSTTWASSGSMPAEAWVRPGAEGRRWDAQPRNPRSCSPRQLPNGMRLSPAPHPSPLRGASCLLQNSRILGFLIGMRYLWGPRGGSLRAPSSPLVFTSKGSGTK